MSHRVTRREQTKLFLLAEVCLIFLAALPFFFPLFAIFRKSVPYGVRLGNYYEEKRDLAEKIKEIEDWTSIDKYKEEFRRGYGHDPNDEEMQENCNTSVISGNTATRLSNVKAKGGRSKNALGENIAPNLD